MAFRALDLSELPIKKHVLDVPSLEELASALVPELCKNFDEVRVGPTDCPDLTQPPFHLAAKGLGGGGTVVEVGGPPYLLPAVRKEKIYDLRTLPKVLGEKKSFLIGAGAGPWPYAGTNCEMILNVVVGPEKVLVPGSRIARIADGQVKLEILPAEEPRCCLLGNIFSCRGEPGKVLKVQCKKRTGNLDFPTAVREAVAATFPDKVIGMGGVFVVMNGKVKTHVMPDFSETPIKSDDELNKWLTFHEMSAPLSIVGTLVSKDPGLDLRVQHFHGFGNNEGGHYHYDVTPDEVEYLGYFACGEILYRVDTPKENPGFGFD